MVNPCKHRRRWLFSDSGIVWLKWCYECGALRRLNYLTNRWSSWYKPVGPGGVNPAVTDMDRKERRRGSQPRDR